MQTIAMTRSDLMLLGGAFRDSSGSALDREAINAIAQANLGRGIHAGGSTLARGALLRALVSETGEGRGDGNGRSTSLLEALLETVSHSSCTSTRGIINCRISGTSASVDVANTLGQVHRLKKFPGVRAASGLQVSGVKQVMVLEASSKALYRIFPAWTHDYPPHPASPQPPPPPHPTPRCQTRRGR